MLGVIVCVNGRGGTGPWLVEAADVMRCTRHPRNGAPVISAAGGSANVSGVLFWVRGLSARGRVSRRCVLHSLTGLRAVVCVDFRDVCV